MRGVVAIVEDDPVLRRNLRRGLEGEGFLCAWAAPTAADAMAHLQVDGVTLDAVVLDAVVLDLGLPDADGLDLLSALRTRGLRCPAVAVTARAGLGDRLQGFGAGLDDYLAKPFSLAELAARLDVMIRRADRREGTSDDGLRLDPDTHQLRCGAAEVALTPLEFRLLGTLLARRGQVVRRATLLTAAWPVGATVHDNTLDSYVARLRRAIREVGAAQELVTVRGVGYRLG